jgi:hypothetical protein
VRDQRKRNLLDDLRAFFEEHEYFGELDGGVWGDRVQWTCTCGAAIDRKVDVTDSR